MHVDVHHLIIRLKQLGCLDTYFLFRFYESQWRKTRIQSYKHSFLLHQLGFDLGLCQMSSDPCVCFFSLVCFVLSKAACNFSSVSIQGRYYIFSQTQMSAWPVGQSPSKQPQQMGGTSWWLSWYWTKELQNIHGLV